jgi:hypothetical protein
VTNYCALSSSPRIAFLKYRLQSFVSNFVPYDISRIVNKAHSRRNLVFPNIILYMVSFNKGTFFYRMPQKSRNPELNDMFIIHIRL